MSLIAYHNFRKKELNLVARRYLFTGRVQGVGFRWTTYNIAQNYQVVGCVLNLDDGRVQVDVEGREDQIEAFVDELNKKMANNINDVASQDIHSRERETLESSANVPVCRGRVCSYS